MPTILFLTADAEKRNNPLDVDIEARDVFERVNLAIGTQARRFLSRHTRGEEVAKEWLDFRSELKPAARAIDLSSWLRDEEPDVLHFSGHGGRDGSVIFQDGEVPGDALVGVIKAQPGQCKLVVLNSCNSHTTAKKLADHVDAAIGMDGTIDDDAAIAFASSFYGHLCFGASVVEAFERAKADIYALTGKKDQQHVPQLFPRTLTAENSKFWSGDLTVNTTLRGRGGRTSQTEPTAVKASIAKVKIAPQAPPPPSASTSRHFDVSLCNQRVDLLTFLVESLKGEVVAYSDAHLHLHRDAEGVLRLESEPGLKPIGATAKKTRTKALALGELISATWCYEPLRGFEPRFHLFFDEAARKLSLKWKDAPPSVSCNLFVFTLHD